MSIRYFTEWTKHQFYKLQVHDEKGTYIMSASGSKPTTYNPFDYADDILFDLLCIGKEPAHPKTMYRALDFCNRYGLLGFGQAVIEKDYDDGNAKLYSGNVFGTKAISEKELMELICPFSFYRQHRNVIPITMRWEVEHSDFLLFDGNYGECVDWIATYAKQLYNMLLTFYKHEPFEYPLGNAKYVLQYDNEVKAIWKYDSLKSATDIMFVELLQSATPSIKLCARCRKPFRVAVGTRAVYCSSSCRNVENVKRSRQRKRLAEKKREVTI